jgi:hypothetical protein
MGVDAADRDRPGGKSTVSNLIYWSEAIRAGRIFGIFEPMAVILKRCTINQLKCRFMLY